MLLSKYMECRKETWHSMDCDSKYKHVILYIDNNGSIASVWIIEWFLLNGRHLNMKNMHCSWCLCDIVTLHYNIRIIKNNGILAFWSVICCAIKQKSNTSC